MDNKDLKQIGEVVEKAVAKGLGEFWEGNLEPAFNSVYERFDQTDHDLKAIENKLDRALYTDMVRLEVRVTRLEERAGIKKK